MSWAVAFGIPICYGVFFTIIAHLLHYFAARSSILAVLEDAITVGHLTISDSQGSHYYGKYQKGCNDVHLTVINDNFWFRILL